MKLYMGVVARHVDSVLSRMVPQKYLYYAVFRVPFVSPFFCVGAFDN